MMMNSRKTPLRIALAALLVLAFAASPPAYADDEEPGAVSKLKAEEIAFLKKKWPEWDKLDASRKERIARGILRVRNLSPEEREKFKQRMERLHKGRKGPRGGRSHGSSIFRVADAVGTRVIDKLPPAVQVDIAKLDVRPSMVKMALFKMLRGKAAAQAGYEFSAEELQALSEPKRALLERLIAQANDPQEGKGRDAARSKLAHMRLLGRMEALRKRLGAEAEDGPVSTEKFADAIMQSWAPAIDGVVAEIGDSPKRFLESVERTSRGHMSRQDYEKSVWVLERYASGRWRRSPELLAATKLVVQRMLIDALGADKDKVAALPGYESGRERRQAIGKLMGGKGGKARARGDRRDGKRRHRPGGGRKKPK